MIPEELVGAAHVVVFLADMAMLTWVYAQVIRN